MPSSGAWAADDASGVTRTGTTETFAAQAPVATVTIDTSRLTFADPAAYRFTAHNPDFSMGARPDNEAPAVMYGRKITAPADTDGAQSLPGKAFTLRFQDAAIDQAGNLHDVLITYSNLTMRVEAGRTASSLALTGGSGVYVQAFDPTGAATPIAALDADITISVEGAPKDATTLFSTVDLDIVSNPAISGGDYSEAFAIVSGAKSDVYIPESNFNAITRIADGKGANGLKIAATEADDGTYNTGFVSLMDASGFTLHWWGAGRGTGTGFYSAGIKYWVRTTTTPGGTISVTENDIDGKARTYGAGQLDVARTKSVTYEMRPEAGGELAAITLDGERLDLSGLGEAPGAQLKIDAANGGTVLLERGEDDLITATVVSIAANHTIDVAWALPVVAAQNATSTGPRNETQTGRPAFSMGSPTLPGGGENTLEYALVGPDGPAASLEVPEGVYEIDQATGEVTFTPAENYHGTATPATVEARDGNGKTARATYTPTVEPTPLTETAKVTRQIILVLDEGHGNTRPALDDNGEPRIEEQTLTVTRQSSIDPDTGEDVWPAWPETTMPAYPAPEIGGWTAHVAAAPVQHGVSPDNPPYDAIIIYDPDPPVSEPAETWGAKNTVQQGTPNFILVSKTTADGSPNRFVRHILLDAELQPAEEVAVPEGTYAIDESTGLIDFTPAKDFLGTATPVYALAVDANRRSVADTYTPHVVENTQQAQAARTVRFVYSDGTAAAEAVRQAVTLRREAEVNRDNGALTWGDWAKAAVAEVFAPAIEGWDADRAAVPAVTVATPGAIGDETIAYSARPPQGTDAESYGGIGQAQTGTPRFTLRTPTVPSGEANRIVRYALQGGSDGKLEVEGGSYTIDSATGTVTFTPGAGWHGNPAPATVTGTDANGLAATATYTPHVVDNEEAHDVERVITYAFEDGTLVPGIGENPVVQKVTFRRFAEVDPASGELTWPVWAPEHLEGFDVPAIEGWSATPSVIPAVDMAEPPADGLPGIDVSFVAGAPMAAGGAGSSGDSAGAESWGLAGAAQTGTVHMTVATPTTSAGTANAMARYELVGADGAAATKLGVEGGTYTIDSVTGAVTFEAAAGFVGDPARATVRGTDLNGKSLEVAYQPHVKAAAEAATSQRTVVYRYADGSPVLGENGKARTAIQEVSWARAAREIDPATGEVTWGAWEITKVAAVESPELAGFAADIATVDATHPELAGIGEDEHAVEPGSGQWDPGVAFEEAVVTYAAIPAVPAKTGNGGTGSPLREVGQPTGNAKGASSGAEAGAKTSGLAPMAASGASVSAAGTLSRTGAATGLALALAGILGAGGLALRGTRRRLAEVA